MCAYRSVCVKGCVWRSEGVFVSVHGMWMWKGMIVNNCTLKRRECECVCTLMHMHTGTTLPQTHTRTSCSDPLPGPEPALQEKGVRGEKAKGPRFQGVALPQCPAPLRGCN